MRRPVIPLLIALSVVLAAGCGDTDQPDGAQPSASLPTEPTEPADREGDAEPADRGETAEPADREGDTAPMDPAEIIELCSRRAGQAAAESPDEPAVLLDSNGSRLCLGPVAFSGPVLDEATALPPGAGGGGFQIALVFTDDGIAQFNRIAASCFASDPTICPSGRVALIHDGAVLLAPTVHAAAFTKDQIVVSGTFDEATDDTIATDLTSQGLTARPVLVDLGPE